MQPQFVLSFPIHKEFDLISDFENECDDNSILFNFGRLLKGEESFYFVLSYCKKLPELDGTYWLSRSYNVA